MDAKIIDYTIKETQGRSFLKEGGVSTAQDHREVK